ncbi:hypothetical protein GGX14DRAFT_676223 [Mycena pura]|uniref:Uncharacterized protein n=1 Tax=Mycena pura TaxID=153505 RepID=A0AAD6VRX3_9AGAR|nr:hypothetical protein GGX14DRAFT_676223 [Mycena pura]
MRHVRKAIWGVIRTVRGQRELAGAYLRHTLGPARNDRLAGRLAEAEARVSREEAADPANQEGDRDDFVPEPEEGVDVVAGQAVVVGEGGARLEQNMEAEEVDPEVLTAAEKKKKRKAVRRSAADTLEASFLSRFACTKECRKLIWDEYFKNDTKAPPIAVAPAGARCCDICEPDLFPVPLFVLKKVPGLKGGRKRKFSTELSDLIRTGLRKWSRDVLMPKSYPEEAGFSMTGSALLPDSTIEQLAMCGERVDTLENLQQRARWFLMVHHGQELLEVLQHIFQDYDANAEAEAPQPDPPGDIFDIIVAGGAARRARGRGPGSRGGRGSGSRGRGTGLRGGRGSGSRARRVTTTSSTGPTGPSRRGRSATNQNE